MAERKHWSTTARVRIFQAAGGVCHVCDGKIHAGDRWELSHVIPLELGGEDAEGNLKPAHYACHRTITARDDVPAISRAKRREASHIGAKAPSRTPMACGRSSRWKRRMDGSVVPRDGM